MRRNNKYTPVESVINIYEPRWWYYIPGFNGYEVSNDGYVRSMKHYIKYPYGILICPVKREPYGQSCDPLFEISDNNNERKRIRLSQLMKLAFSANYQSAGYPRATVISDPTSRNTYVKNKQGMFVKVHSGNSKNKIKIPPMDNTMEYAKFTIIEDGTELPQMFRVQPEITVPIKSIKGDEYYGRKDCRTICDIDVHRGPS